MRLPKFSHLQSALALGALSGLALGCVVTFGPLEPCASGSNNQLDSDGECECRVSYEWCDASDPANLECCEDPTFASGENSSGDSASGDGDGDTTSGTGDGDGDGDGDGGTLPPEDCDVSTDIYWCTHTEAMGPQGSSLYVCDTNSKWVLDTEMLGDQNCALDGWDFSYGCVTTAVDVLFECGAGPGTACDNADPAVCADMDLLQECTWGKLTETSCQWFCETEGVGGVTFEFGECAVDVTADCDCYDAP